MLMYPRVRRDSWLAALVCLFIAVATLIGCGRMAAVPMPQVKTMDGSFEVQVYPGDWEWRGMRSNLRLAPHEMLKDSYATILPAGSTLLISYAQPPKKGSLRARLWIGDTPIEQSLTGDNRFTIPSQPGVYIYDFEATWRQGSATYLIKVEASGYSG